ncbi:hypothetical protein NMY22_g5191 [Coprinellus aureogranulatus]|nr:hypothetical protein NMY22_g5191 [Coprinellus aureogranulatus]
MALTSQISVESVSWQTRSSVIRQISLEHALASWIQPGAVTAFEFDSGPPPNQPLEFVFSLSYGQLNESVLSPRSACSRMSRSPVTPPALAQSLIQPPIPAPSLPGVWPRTPLELLTTTELDVCINPQVSAPTMKEGPARPNKDEHSWHPRFRLQRFVPNSAVQNMKLLSDLGNPFGRGLRRYQICQIVRECSRCNGVCFMDRRHLHECQGITLCPPRDGPELLEAMLCEYGNRGLRRADFMGLLSLCNLVTMERGPGPELKAISSWFSALGPVPGLIAEVTEWLRKTSLDIVEAHGSNFTFDSSAFAQEVSSAIGRSPLASITEQGTGLPHGINQANCYTSLNEVVLELVHLTDVGVRALTLEGVRQEREHRIYLDRVARTSSCDQAKTLRDLEWLRPELTPYPRKCLKMFLSDGNIELQAIEVERLCGIELGITPMGTKIHLANVPIIGGVAYLRNENIKIVGGFVAHLQKVHCLRLYEDLQRRMDEDDNESQPESGDKHDRKGFALKSHLSSHVNGGAK